MPRSTVCSICNMLAVYVLFTSLLCLANFTRYPWLVVQLRAQEVISRLDQSLALTAKHGLASQVFDDIYSPSPSSSSSVKGDKSSGGGGDSSMSIGMESKLSLSIAELLQMEATPAVNLLCAHTHPPQSPDSGSGCPITPITWKLSLTRVFVIEMLTCLHTNVFLKDLSSKMVSLVIKILNCFNIHMLALIDCKGAGALGTHDSASLSSPSPSASSASKNTTPGAGAVSAAHTLSLEELTWGISDVLQLAAWIQHSLSPLLLRTLCPPVAHIDSDSDSDSDTDANASWRERQQERSDLHNRHATLIQGCFDKQVASVLKLSPLIWTKMADILVVDCRSGLKVSE